MTKYAALVLAGLTYLTLAQPNYVPVGQLEFALVTAQDTLPPFPEAKSASSVLGTCRDSVVNGSWDVKVYTVTSSNPTADGGLSSIITDSLSDTSFDFIVGSTGMKITGGVADFIINNACVYVALQATQGGGVTLDDVDKGIGVGAGGDNVLIRYVRQYDGSDGFSNRGGENVHFDHVSAALFSLAGGQMQMTVGSGDTTASATGDEDNVDNSSSTYGLFFWPDSGHQTLFTSTGEPRSKPATNHIFAWRNAGIGPGHRSPMCSADSVIYAENILFNHDIRATESNHECIGDFIYNFVDDGPSTTGGDSDYGHVMGDECSSYTGSDSSCLRSIHWSKNAHWKNSFSNSGASDVEDWVGPARMITCRGVDTGETFDCTDGQAVDTTTASGPGGANVKRNTALDFLTHAPTYVGVDSARADSLIDFVGVYRLLTCDGQWRTSGVRSTIDSTVIAQFKSRTGPSSVVASDTFTIETPTAGTACTDTDSDGLPDDYEKRIMGSSDSTGLPPDSASSSGYLAIELYLDARHFDWSVGGGVGVQPPTYNDDRIVYLAPLVQDTFVFGGGSDTIVRKRPDPDSLATGIRFRAIFRPNGDSALVLTYDTITGRTAQDSSSVDSILADWGVPLTPHPSTVPVPGQP